MKMKTFGFAGALVALTLMIGLVAGSSTVSAKSVPGGSVFITGHDPDYHGQVHPGGSCDVPGAQNLMTVAIKYARNGSKKPLLVVLGDNYLTPPGYYRNSLLALDTVESNYVRMNASDFANANLTPKKYAAIFVPSDDGGMLRQAELDALNARKDDIRAYLNGGGGLVALAETNGGPRPGPTPLGGHFGFLPVSVNSTAYGHGSAGTTVTTFGTGIGLTADDVDCNYSHNYFGSDGGMNVVDYYTVDRVDQIKSLAYRGFYGQDEIVIEDEDGKVSICHASGDDTDPSYHLISVPANAMETHFPSHGDKFPDEDGNCPAPE